MTAREMEMLSTTGQWHAMAGNRERDRWKEILEDFFEIQEAQMTDSSPLALEGDDFSDYYDIMGWFTLESGFPGMLRFSPAEGSTHHRREPVLWNRSFDPYLWEWGSLRYDLPQ